MTALSNYPPLSTDPLAERLAETYADLVDRTEELVAAAARVPAMLDETTLRTATDFVAKQLKRHRKTVLDAHKFEKEPFLTGGRIVDGHFKSMADRLEVAIQSVERTISLYLRAKEAEARRQREAAAARARADAEARAKAMVAEADLNAALDAEQAAVEAEEAALASVAELARSRTAHGSVATLRKQWVFEVTDWAEIDLEMLREHFAVEHMDQAIRSYIRAGGRELSGVTIREEVKALVRG